LAFSNDDANFFPLTEMDCSNYNFCFSFDPDADDIGGSGFRNLWQFHEIDIPSNDKKSNIDIDLDELLTPTRVEDKGSDLWSVFNVIQEKLVHGMFSYDYGTKTRKARKIKNFKQDMVVNEKLYELALEYAQVAA